MNNVQEQITKEDVINYIEEQQEIVEEVKVFERLEENPDFKKVITDGLFRDRAAQLVRMSNDPRLAQDERDSVMDEIRGLSSVAQYLEMIKLQGGKAQQNIQRAYMDLNELESGAE